MCTTWQRIPLRHQLAIAVAGVLVVLLTAFSSLLYLSIRYFLYHQAEVQLRAAATAAIGPVMQPVLTYLPAEPPSFAPVEASILEEVRKLEDSLSDFRTSAVILAPDGTPWLQSSTLPSFHERHALAPASAGVQVGDRPSEEQFSEVIQLADGSRHLIVDIPLHNMHGGYVGSLQMSTPTRPIEEVLQHLFWYLTGGTLATIAGSMVLCIVASSRVLRPLQRVVYASAQVAEGDFTTRLDLPPGNEVGKLGLAFDHMVARTAEAFAAQQRFIADAAHELRTPLTAIGGSIEVLQLGAADHRPEHRRRLLNSIGSEVERLGRLVNNLLLLSRLNQDTRQRHTPCDLVPLLHDLVEQSRIVAPTHEIVAELPPTLPLLGNEDQLHQVFLNLLTNAHTYTPPGGTIMVKATAKERISVSIQDTGIGIPPDELPHIWDRLYRVDRSRSRAAGGFGLGLAIVHSLVTAHGGEVSATSTPGQGTTVVVTLPRGC